MIFVLKQIKIFSAIFILISLIITGCGGGSSGGVNGDIPGGTTNSEGTLSLAWDANTEPYVAGYRVYYGTASETYGPPIDVGNVTTYTLKYLITGQTYFVSVTAYATSNEESGFSDEVSAAAK